MPINRPNAIKGDAKKAWAGIRLPSGKPINKVGFASRKLRPTPFKESTLKVFDIPVDMLIESPDNVNQMDEKTFDQLIQGMKTDGFDEPIHVIPIENGPNKDKYIIVSGHHRAKAGRVVGMKAIPSIIKPGWSDDKRKFEIVRRNMLRGKLDQTKFTKLFDELAKKGYDLAVIKLQMGFTQEKAFNELYKQVSASMTPAQRKELAKAKETIKNVDGLSAAVNRILQDHGSNLDHGFVIFNYANKDFHYVECDKELDKRMRDFETSVKDKGLFMADVFKELIKNADLSKMQKSAKVEERRNIRMPKKKD